MKSKPLGSKPAAPSVQATVGRRLSSERDFIREAFARWSDGDFDGCLRDLDDIGIGRHTSQSILLRARALLRLQRAEDAAKWLQMMESRHTDDDALATHSMLLGSAYAQLREFDRATVYFNSARRAAPHPTIVSETAYYQALCLWQARDYSAARGALQPAICAQQDIVTARALQLLGFVAIAEHDFAEAHRHFNAALHSLIVCRARDKHLEATLLHVLSIGQAEVEVRDPGPLDKLARDFEWTNALVLEHVQTLRHIGLAYARTNQPDLALDRMVEAASVQSDSPWAVIGFSEAANLCYELNECVSAGFYVRLCCRVADDICWTDVMGESRLALLQLATAVARSGNGNKARRYLDLYYGPDRQGARLPALSALNFDSRLHSFERHAEAIVRGTLGASDAIPLLVDVEREWRLLKYRHRSREARNDIRALTHRFYQIREAGTGRTLEGEEQTPVTPDTPSTAGDKPEGLATIGLTAQQDRIIRQLVRGRSIAQIADNLALRQKTVRNHLVRMYALFEVSGQSQLVATILGNPGLRQLFLTFVFCLVLLRSITGV